MDIDLIKGIFEILLMAIVLAAGVFATIVGALNNCKTAVIIGLIVSIVFTIMITISIIRLFAL
jgi:hypothetical protein